MSIREQEARRVSRRRSGAMTVSRWTGTLACGCATSPSRPKTAPVGLPGPAATAQCRRELASSPTTAGISERLAAMLQLAHRGGRGHPRVRRANSDSTVTDAFARADRRSTQALRDAIQREIDELSDTRELLLQRLIELGGEVISAYERFCGYPPGHAPLPAAAALYDAEADAIDDHGGRQPRRHADRAGPWSPPGPRGPSASRLNTIGKCRSSGSRACRRARGRA